MEKFRGVVKSGENHLSKDLSIALLMHCVDVKCDGFLSSKVGISTLCWRKAEEQNEIPGGLQIKT
jgi:hypothetical protein